MAVNKNGIVVLGAIFVEMSARASCRRNLAFRRKKEME